MVWFTDADLLDLAGSRSYNRGTGYLTAVGRIRDLPDGVVATVTGTDIYQVRLYDDEGELTGDCTCPYGEEGNFCKHCVAVGLRLLAEDTDARDGSDDDADDPDDTFARHGAGSSNAVGEAEVKTFLTAMDHTDLVDLVWRQASADPTLYHTLRLMAAASAGTPDLALLRSQVRRLDVSWIGYSEEEGYTDDAYAVVSALASMITEHAATVQPLLRQAVTLIGTAVGHCETECILISEAAANAWAVYLQACEAAPPDQAELGRWIAHYRLEGHDLPEMKLDEYADLLGAAGLDAYWEVLDAANAANPSGYAVRRAREEMIAATGNVDAIVACHAEDLSTPRRYVEIAEILCDDGRAEQAIAWLERGRAQLASASTGAPDLGWQATQLVDLLAQLYTQAGRHADVLALREEYLGRASTLQAYTALRAAVRNAPAGGGGDGGDTTIPSWDTVRPRALEILRKAVTGGRAWLAMRELVGALLLEDEIDQAWTLVTTKPCDIETQLAVAARRGRTHPDDAITMYLPVIEQAVTQTTKAGYERAATLLATLRGLPTIGDTDFAQHLERLKQTHRRKTNFLAALRRRKL